jgi:cytidine deaminase
MPKHSIESLFAAAHEVRKQSHSRYSGFRVGVALEDENGAMHVGCNVENASFPEGTCAESNAIGAMVASGGRHIKTIAVVGGHDAPQFCTPCGGCRQRIREFSDSNTVIVLLDDAGKPLTFDIDSLLPHSFVLK